MKMNKGKIALRIHKDNFGKVKIPTPNGDIVLQIDTGFEAAQYFTQYSEVVFVPDDEKEIKVGMFVFHNHNVYSESTRVDDDIFWTTKEFIFGTVDKMFGEYVMVDKIFEKKDTAIGTIGINARVEQIDEPLKNKCIVLTGKYAGKTMYCSDIMFYEIVGYDKKIYIAKEKQLISDEAFNPCENKLLVMPFADELVVRKSGVIVARNFTKPQCKSGNVIRSYNGDYLNQNIAYTRYYHLTIDGTPHHIVESKNVECVFETNEELTPLI
jgi:hypothetical protein